MSPSRGDSCYVNNCFVNNEHKSNSQTEDIKVGKRGGMQKMIYQPNQHWHPGLFF